MITLQWLIIKANTAFSFFSSLSHSLWNSLIHSINHPISVWYLLLMLVWSPLFYLAKTFNYASGIVCETPTITLLLLTSSIWRRKLNTFLWNVACAEHSIFQWTIFLSLNACHFIDLARCIFYLLKFIDINGWLMNLIGIP